MKTNFIDFWSSLFLRPKTFFLKNIEGVKQRPAYFYLAIIIYGIGYGIGKLQEMSEKHILNDNLEEISFLNDWTVFWLIAILGGIFFGMISYCIGGWFFNVRLKWSKGTGDINKSRYIYVYSWVVFFIVIIFTAIVNTFIEDKPYTIKSDFNLWEGASSILMLFFMYYSIYVSYCGVRAITDANKFRSRLWFLILPIALYTILVPILGVLLVNLSG